MIFRLRSCGLQTKTSGQANSERSNISLHITATTNDRCNRNKSKSNYQVHAYINPNDPPTMPRTIRASKRLIDNAKLRSTVTPSPKSQDSDGEGNDESSTSLCMEDPHVEVITQNSKTSAKRKQRVVESKNERNVKSNNGASDETVVSKRGSKRIKNDEPDRSDNENIMTIFKNDATAFRAEAATMAKQKTEQKPTPQKLYEIDGKETEEMICVPCDDSEDPVVDTVVAGGVNKVVADEGENNEDEEDRPFTVEFATSSRATCRRCDAVILKGEIRISHVPLFRGKPGYRVYRHLQCAVFSDEIMKVEDVGGWRKLDAANLELLRQRVQESQLEIEQENEDLDPDELVQKGFQGEIRMKPSGFVGTQLPFQIEGQSWMYHQEVHVPEIRGGILADEMGMVR
jgi:hypothetical protein